MANVLEYLKAEVWKKMNVLLSFDVEEFDLPREYLIYISEEEMYLQSYRGLLRILDLLDKYKLKATFFVTLNFAKKYPELIREVSEKHEIGCHGYSHIDNYNKKGTERISDAKKGIEKIIGKKIYGFRAPRGNCPGFRELSKTGFVYDSSLHPVFIPGRYNHFLESRRIFKQNNIIEIPWATSTFLRLPLFGFALRNFGGLGYAKIATKLYKLNFAVLGFHPWEFIEISQKVPLYTKRNSGDKIFNVVEKYIGWCLSRGYKFKSCYDYLKDENIIA
ncbi:MAG: polysaccharide deacetylase family protein [Candidatus Nanoarchaeia archaeon]|nr:polysaccharide deacetylase family protein [Candidatus Nanoarchaeia archaeon]